MDTTSDPGLSGDDGDGGSAGGERVDLDLGGRVLVLASSSPRRRELLGRLGLPFTIVDADVDESVAPGERPADLVARLAAAKARAGARHLDAATRERSIVIGADTVVDVDGKVFGKPGSDDEARSMLRRLSGRRHRVHSGMAIVVDGHHDPAWTAAPFADVTMRAFSETDIDAYVATGEPHDKAGAYAIQGEGGRFVTSVVGSRTVVVGLGLDELRRGLSVIREC